MISMMDTNFSGKLDVKELTIMMNLLSDWIVSWNSSELWNVKFFTNLPGRLQEICKKERQIRCYGVAWCFCFHRLSSQQSNPLRGFLSLRVRRQNDFVRELHSQRHKSQIYGSNVQVERSQERKGSFICVGWVGCDGFDCMSMNKSCNWAGIDKSNKFLIKLNETFPHVRHAEGLAEVKSKVVSNNEASIIADHVSVYFRVSSSWRNSIKFHIPRKSHQLRPRTHYFTWN